MGDDANGSWGSKELGGFLRREESQEEWEKQLRLLDESYDDWLERLRRENRESERQHIEAERERIGATSFGSEPTDWLDGTFAEDDEDSE